MLVIKRFFESACHDLPEQIALRRSGPVVFLFLGSPGLRPSRENWGVSRMLRSCRFIKPEGRLARDRLLPTTGLLSLLIPGERDIFWQMSSKVRQMFGNVTQFCRILYRSRFLRSGASRTPRSVKCFEFRRSQNVEGRIKSRQSWMGR